MKNIKMEWIPIKTRPLTDEERKSISQYCGVIYELTADVCAFDCPMPTDGQEILISTSWGVDRDVCEYDRTDEGFSLYSLEERGDWDGVNAWMPLPDPYKDPLDHSDEDIRCKAEGCNPEGCKHCDHYEPIEFGGE